MKKCWLLIILCVSLLYLCACSRNTNEQTNNTEQITWQEQYDLGVRYLSEGNYEEAIIAFTAAIEIDPKQAPAYVGRGDAYVLSGGTEENLAAAQVDYEMAIELDGTLTDAYLGLAEVYIQKGEQEKAREVLKNVLEKLGSNLEIENKLSKIKDYNSYGGIEFTERYGYRDTTNLTKQEISWLETAFDAAVDFDETTLEQLAIQCMADTNNQGVPVIRTIWNGYKVEFSCDKSYYNAPSLHGEFRPENAIGYSFFIDTPGEPTGVVGSSYGGISRLASCQCFDWQWNGIATIVDVDLLMDTNKVDISTLSNGTVPMVNSLRDGDYIQNYTHFTVTTTYSDGIIIALDGEAQEANNVFWSIISGLNGPQENILGSLYW